MFGISKIKFTTIKDEIRDLRAKVERAEVENAGTKFELSIWTDRLNRLEGRVRNTQLLATIGLALGFGSIVGNVIQSITGS